MQQWIKCLPGETELELYWNKPENVLPGTDYKILLDDAEAGTTNVTHFTLRGLFPGAQYRIQVLVRKRAAENASGRGLLPGECEREARTDISIQSDSGPEAEKLPGGVEGRKYSALRNPDNALSMRAAKGLTETRTRRNFSDEAGAFADGRNTFEGRKNSADYRKIGTLTCSTLQRRKRIDVTKEPYCAVGDGKTLNTRALQQAIRDCAPDQMVYLPEGTYLTGALDLHSNMELYLAEGAILQGTADPADYLPYIPSRFEGYEMECYRSLLNLGSMDHTRGPVCSHVIIRGKGQILGGGTDLHMAIRQAELENLRDYMDSLGEKLAEYQNEYTIPDRKRGRLINLSNCSDVRISGLTLGQSPSWNVHMIYSSDIVTDHCHFVSEGIFNGDGWDPDSSRDCTLFACTFDTGDDAVAIKSGKNPEGNQIDLPTMNVNIFDCVSHYGHGIVIGSEMSGGVDGVYIWDCDLERSSSGFEVKTTKKRGGYVRNIQVRDSALSRVMFHTVTYNDDGQAARTLPLLSDCSFRNVYIRGEYLDDDSNWIPCIPIELSEYCSNVSFTGIHRPESGWTSQGAPTGMRDM